MAVHKDIVHFLDACSVPRELGRTRKLLVPVGIVNVLTQMRDADEDLEELLQSILDKGQLYHGIATVLTEHEAERYLKGINDVYRSEHKLGELLPIKESARSAAPLFIILVAGERRYNACSLGAARIQAKTLVPTVHFDGAFYVELRFGMSVDEALDIQMTENTYNPPKPAKASVSYWRSYRYKKSREPNLSIAEFARMVGRSSSSMHAALRFAELPECLQKLANEPKKKGGLPFQALAELGRYLDAVRELGTSGMISAESALRHTSDDRLRGMATFIWSKELKPKDVRSFISTAILQASGSAPQLFEAVDLGSDAGALINSRAAAMTLSKKLQFDMDFFDGLLRLARDGEFRGHHPIRPRRMSAESAHHAVARVVGTAAEVTRQLDDGSVLRGKDIRTQALRVLPEAEQTLRSLDADAEPRAHAATANGAYAVS